jgi:hypothetical protein
MPSQDTIITIRRAAPYMDVKMREKGTVYGVAFVTYTNRGNFTHACRHGAVGGWTDRQGDARQGESIRGSFVSCDAHKRCALYMSVSTVRISRLKE